MSGLDFTGLGDLAAKGSNTPAGWEPLAREQLGLGVGLFFDQSLAATGWANIWVRPFEVIVLSAGTISGREFGEDAGVERDLRRSTDDVFHGVRTLIAGTKYSESYEYAHESPPNMSALKGKGSPVSSLMASVSVRCAAYAEGVEMHMYGAQPAKFLICGNRAEKSKAKVHAALKEHCFPWITGSEKITNEGQRDALMIGLLHFYRKGRP